MWKEPLASGFVDALRGELSWEMHNDLPASAAGYFGSMVESYDSLIHRAVPRYDEMTARLIDYLPPNPGSVLELGCGTGNLSLLLARKFPRASITLVDGSPDMIALTRSRIRDAGLSVNEPTYVAAQFEELALPESSFDLVVSSISLHHVADKPHLYRQIRALLRAGGSFCFADQIRGEPESNHRINWERWLDYCREPGHCTQEEIDSLLDHAAAHDHYVPLAQHVSMLSDAGFIDVDCVWRNWMWGIVTTIAA
jgi:tRNA (cmo5U34)-methyltransferase